MFPLQDLQWLRSNELCYLPRGFSPYRESDVAAAILKLTEVKGDCAASGHEAMEFFSFYAELSDVLSEAHARLEIAVWRGGGHEAERRFREFESTIYARVIKSRKDIFEKFFFFEELLKKANPKIFFHFFEEIKKRFQFSVLKEPQLIVEESRLNQEVRCYFSANETRCDSMAPSLRVLLGCQHSVHEEQRCRAYADLEQFLTHMWEPLFRKFYELYRVRVAVAKAADAPSYQGYRRCELGRFEWGDDADGLLQFGVQKHLVPLIQEHLATISKGKIPPWNIASGAVVTGVSFTSPEVFAFVDECFGAFSADWLMVWKNLCAKNHCDMWARNQKQTGAFTVALGHSRSAYLFSHCGGGLKDILTFFHECGHGLHAVLGAQQNEHPMQRLPGLELCETVASFFELVAAQKMGERLGNTSVLRKVLWQFFCFLPLCAQIDAWQKDIYDDHILNPEASLLRWSESWERSGVAFQPYINHDDWGGRVTKRLGWLLRQHLYVSPFYYIEYAWAQIMAMQIFARFQKDPRFVTRQLDAYMKLGAFASVKDFCRDLEIALPFHDQAFAALKEIFYESL